MQEAITIIRAEHRSLAAVLHGLQSIVDVLDRQGGKPDFGLLFAMLTYIDEFPDRFHHPKEDQYLFRQLRLRAPDAVGLLDALEAEHKRNGELMAGLRRALKRFEEHPEKPEARDAFRNLVKQYAEFHWSHMRLEEEQVFPLAEVRLNAQDWADINAAFRSNADPLIGTEAKDHYQDMLRNIVSRAPAPIGVGARWT